LSKHIKKYHPGHTQELTPVPVQEDELINMQNQNKSSTTQQTIVIEAASTSAGSSTSSSDNKFFLPLLPRHPVQQAELVGFSKDLSTGQDNVDPSLDDNILDLLASEDATESPLLSSISPGPSLPPPPPPPPPSMPPPKMASASVSTASGATIVSSKLHEVLTQGRPKPSASEAFVVPKNKTGTTHIVNLATGTGVPVKTKPLAISISQVFACAQPLPLQEDAKFNNKGKMTTMADLETRGFQPAAFVQGLVNARKTGTTIIATSGSGGVIRTGHGSAQQVSIIKPAGVASVAASTLTSTSASNTKAGKTFACDFKGCNKSFEKITFLKRHAKLHSSSCKFVCDVCTKCFESQSKLDDHYRKHTGAKPFICHICGNAFRYKGDRTKHLKNIHGVLKSAMTSTISTAPEAGSSANGNNGAMVSVNQAFIVEDTSSSISSFQSTSDQSSLAGSLVESPTKSEPLDSAFNSMTSNSASMLTNANNDDDDMTETITMTLEDINQFAQDIY